MTAAIEILQERDNALNFMSNFTKAELPQHRTSKIFSVLRFLVSASQYIKMSETSLRNDPDAKYDRSGLIVTEDKMIDDNGVDRRFFEFNNYKYTIAKEPDFDFYRIGKDVWNDGCYLFYSVQKGTSFDDAIVGFIKRETL